MARARLPLSEEAFHPREFIAGELRPRGMTQRELARQIGRPYHAIHEIFRGRKALAAETALARVFRTASGDVGGAPGPVRADGSPGAGSGRGGGTSGGILSVDSRQAPARPPLAGAVHCGHDDDGALPHP